MTQIYRKLNESKALEILRNSNYGILSTSSENNIPFGTAINYFFAEDENCLYFHSKKTGTKINNIKNNSNISLFIIRNQNIVSERFITHYESVIVTGKAEIIFNENEIRKKLILLCDRFAPGIIERREAVINKYIKSVCIVKINIDCITGKKNEDY